MKKFLQRCLNPPHKDVREYESSTEYESGTDSSSTQTSSSNKTQSFSPSSSSSYASSSNSYPNTSAISKSRANSVNSGHKGKDTLKSSSRKCLNNCTNPKPKDKNCLKKNTDSRQRRSIGSVKQPNGPIERNDNSNPNGNGNGIQINREGRKGFQPNAYNKRNTNNYCVNYALADYVQIAPLPEFHGLEEENPDSHITRFLRACRINNANIPKAWILLFPITLHGKAAMWYDSQIEGNLLDWTELQKAFTEAFRSPQHTERLRQHLMKFRQESHETVCAYFERLQSILYNWPDHGIPDAILKGIYMDGLNEDGQDWLILQQPTSLKEAVKLSLHWEEAQNAKLRRRTEGNNWGLENKGQIFNNISGLKNKAENSDKNKGEIFNNNLGLENKGEIFNNNLGLKNKGEIFNNNDLGLENKGETFNCNLQVYRERCEECEGKGHRLEECTNFLRKKTKIDQMNTMGWSVYMPIFLNRNLNKLRNWINSVTRD